MQDATERGDPFYPLAFSFLSLIMLVVFFKPLWRMGSAFFCGKESPWCTGVSAFQHLLVAAPCSLKRYLTVSRLGLRKKSLLSRVGGDDDAQIWRLLVSPRLKRTLFNGRVYLVLIWLFFLVMTRQNALGFDPYRELGLDGGTATLSQVKQRARSLLREFHPDRTNSRHTRARFERVQKAYRAIVKPDAFEADIGMAPRTVGLALPSAMTSGVGGALVSLSVLTIIPLALWVLLRPSRYHETQLFLAPLIPLAFLLNELLERRTRSSNTHMSRFGSEERLKYALFFGEGISIQQSSLSHRKPLMRMLCQQLPPLKRLAEQASHLDWDRIAIEFGLTTEERNDVERLARSPTQWPSMEELEQMVVVYEQREHVLAEFEALSRPEWEALLYTLLEEAEVCVSSALKPVLGSFHAHPSLMDELRSSTTLQYIRNQLLGSLLPLLSPLGEEGATSQHPTPAAIKLAHELPLRLLRLALDTKNEIYEMLAHASYRQITTMMNSGVDA